MNSCLQCGKEVPEGKKFCNSSCSAKYNNSRRVRKPWTEEQKEQFSLRRVQALGTKLEYECQGCGEIVKSKKPLKYCVNCIPHYRVLRVLEQLGVWKKGDGIREGVEKAKKLLSREYFENKESLLTLSKKYGVCKDTIRSYLPEVRSRKEATLTAVEQGRVSPIFVCPGYKTGTHTSWEGNKYTFRSSWEEEYMQELDSKKISYLYEPFKVRYFDSQKGTERLAIPDFFFPETNTIVELKSSWTYDEQNMKDRVKSYKEKGYKVILLLDWKKTAL